MPVKLSELRVENISISGNISLGVILIEFYLGNHRLALKFDAKNYDIIEDNEVIDFWLKKIRETNEEDKNG